MHNSDGKVDRRAFLGATAGVVASSAFPSTALSYRRILGANDRIALGHIGVGNRGSGLHTMVSHLKDKHNVETVAVCDLWKTNRERAAAETERYYGRAPRAMQYLEDLLALKDVDAVVIATPEHSHSPVLKAVAEAGQARVLREADGERARRSEGGARRGQGAQPRRPGGHAASQRTVPARRA